jgi:alkylhydroperoxidase family enzyme
LPNYALSPLYDEVERVTLKYADCMTITGLEVSDELFARLREFYDDDAIVELSEIIAWENASSKFNRALRIPSQQLWKR